MPDLCRVLPGRTTLPVRNKYLLVRVSYLSGTCLSCSLGYCLQPDGVGKCLLALCPLHWSLIFHVTLSSIPQLQGKWPINGASMQFPRLLFQLPPIQLALMLAATASFSAWIKPQGTRLTPYRPNLCYLSTAQINCNFKLSTPFTQLAVSLGVNQE